MCSGVCLPASLALTGTWSKPTPAAFWPRGTCLINHALVPMKGLVLLPAVDQSVAPRGPWQGLAYHPWSGPIHVSQTKMDSACHARMYHAWSLLHKLNMRSGGVLLKKEKDPEDVSLLRFTHAVFLSSFFAYDSDSVRHGKREEWGEGINRCRGELENSVLKDLLKCLWVCVWSGNLWWPKRALQRAFWWFSDHFHVQLALHPYVQNELSFQTSFIWYDQLWQIWIKNHEHFTKIYHLKRNMVLAVIATNIHVILK